MGLAADDVMWFGASSVREKIRRLYSANGVHQPKWVESTGTEGSMASTQ